MCGEEIVKQSKENWKSYIPRLLELGNEDSTLPVENVDAGLKALVILDSKLRTSGLAAKYPGAFTLHLVMF